MKQDFDLEDRLITFATSLIRFIQKLPPDYTNQHLSRQILRSGTSPALNYAEAQAAESTRDFVHKMKITLKELRETQVCLKIISRTVELESDALQKESRELVAIFTQCVKTAQKNLRKANL
jgi:four helix bundle protein